MTISEAIGFGQNALSKSLPAVARPAFNAITGGVERSITHKFNSEDL
ncbi:hypothetical protein [Vibrio litoralis]|nr:hypothetical protein [Vibrio litoralis]